MRWGSFFIPPRYPSPLCPASLQVREGLRSPFPGCYFTQERRLIKSNAGLLRFERGRVRAQLDSCFASSLEVWDSLRFSLVCNSVADVYCCTSVSLPRSSPARCFRPPRWSAPAHRTVPPTPRTCLSRCG